MTSKTASHPLSDFSKASENLAKNLSYESFDPVLYVKSVSARIDGDQELEEEKLKITKLSDETAQILKKQVYNNYLQFIDTAKEISNLEQEMKQINQILAKQKDVMDRMSKVLVSDSGVDMEAKMKEQEATKEREDKEEQQVKALSTILEKVEDCDPNLIKAGRFLVFDGRVAELEAENFQPFQEVHLFLLKNGLKMGSFLVFEESVLTYSKGQKIGFEQQNTTSIELRFISSIELETEPISTILQSFFVGIELSGEVFQIIRESGLDSWIFKIESKKKCKIK